MSKNIDRFLQVIGCFFISFLAARQINSLDNNLPLQAWAIIIELGFLFLGLALLVRQVVKTWDQP